MSDLTFGERAKVALNPGQILRVTTSGVAEVEALEGAPLGTTTVTASSRDFGPYSVAARLIVESLAGTVSYGLSDYEPALTAAEVLALRGGTADVLDITDAYVRWCIPGKDTSGTQFKDVSGRGNHATIEANNSTPFAVDNRMSTIVNATAGGIVVPLAATECNLLTDSVIMAFTVTNEDPAGSESVASFGAGTGNHPGMYLSHRSSAAGVGRIVCNRGNGTLVSGADSTVKFSNAGGTRETHVFLALDGPTGSVYLYRDGVLAASNVGLMTGANVFTIPTPVFGARLGSTGGTAATVAGVFRGWQGYVFPSRGVPLNIGRVAAMLAASPETPLANREFIFA